MICGYRYLYSPTYMLVYQKVFGLIPWDMTFCRSSMPSSSTNNVCGAAMADVPVRSARLLSLVSSREAINWLTSGCQCGSRVSEKKLSLNQSCWIFSDLFMHLCLYNVVTQFEGISALHTYIHTIYIYIRVYIPRTCLCFLFEGRIEE